MEDHRLRAFCLVVETQSFSKAAAEKSMTQSAMSHLIRNLEDELGVKLLTRGARKAVPTSAGKALYRHANKILEQYRQMENDMGGLLKEVRGRLHIGATPTIATYLLPQVLYDFSTAHPAAGIHVSVANSEGVIREVREARLDAGLVEGTLTEEPVVAEQFAEDEMVVVAAENNPLARKKVVSPRDLLPQPFILPEPGSGTRECINDFFSHLGIDPAKIRETLTVGSPELLVQLVQSGLGLSVVSKWSAFRPVKEGAIKILPVAGKRWSRRLYIVSLEREPSTLLVRTFRGFVRAYRFFEPL